MIHLPMAFSFAWVGFFYLVNLEISFSIWFFYLFCKVEDGLFTYLGIRSTELQSGYDDHQSADLTHQATGAVIVFRPLRPLERPSPLRGCAAQGVESQLRHRRQRGATPLPHGRHRFHRQPSVRLLLVVALGGCLPFSCRFSSSSASSSSSGWRAR